ncbi:hypothetical protein C8R44DRAFT_745927 [Mycena epipterygia]|nr:hypothetical protein C8R44DRAFT_745927 [Mycena epipterygia]
MSSTSQLKITRLPKLKDDGSNWINYRDLAMNTLTAKGLRRHVVGTIKAPKELVVRDGAFYLPGRLAPLSDDELEEHETKLDEYLQKQAQVREVIYQTVSEATFMRIKSAPTAQLMLQQLSLRCPEDGDIILHITEMKCLKEALDWMSAPIADAQFSAYIKAALPPEKFGALLSTISTASRIAGRPISSEALIQEIYETCDESTVHKNSASNAEDTAMAASGKRRGGGKHCDNCDRTSHIKKDCWSKGGGKEGQGPRGKGKGKGKSKASENANSASKDDDNDVDVAPRR